MARQAPGEMDGTWDATCDWGVGDLTDVRMEIEGTRGRYGDRRAALPAARRQPCPAAPSLPAHLKLARASPHAGSCAPHAVHAVFLVMGYESRLTRLPLPAGMAMRRTLCTR